MENSEKLTDLNNKYQAVKKFLDELESFWGTLEQKDEKEYYSQVYLNTRIKTENTLNELTTFISKQYLKD